MDTKMDTPAAPVDDGLPWISTKVRLPTPGCLHR